MSDDAVLPFIGEYEMSVDDLRELDIVERLAAWRAKSLVSRWAFPVLSIALAAVTVFVNQATIGCFVPQSTPSQAPFQPWVWQCDPTVTPSDLVWQNVWLFAADGALWVLTLLEVTRAWFRPPRWLVRMMMKRQGLGGRYRYEVADDGLTAARPDGSSSYIPWPYFAAVRETSEQFFLFGPRYKSTWVLPKRALGDRSAVQPLGEFLRASVAGRS
jgi:hypothetical protein